MTAKMRRRTLLEILRMPEVRERYRTLTAEGPDTTPERYTAFVRDELRAWGEVVRTTGATAERERMLRT